MCGLLIKLGARAKRKRGRQIQELSSKIQFLEAQNKINTTPATAEQLTKLRYDLRLILLVDFEKASRKLKMSYYANGNKAGKILAA